MSARNLVEIVEPAVAAALTTRLDVVDTSTSYYLDPTIGHRRSITVTMAVDTLLDEAIMLARRGGDRAIGAAHLTRMANDLVRSFQPGVS